LPTRRSTFADTGNRILGSLPPEELNRLSPFLEPFVLRHEMVLHQADETINHVYFPLSGMVSLVTVLLDGDAVETATAGNEGIIGLSLFLGTGVSSVRAIVQVSGQSLRMGSEDFLAAVPYCPVLESALRLYVDYVLALTAQSAACNRLHPVNERCARWLLTTHDRAASDEFHLTQELLSQMLGVRRPSVTVAASALAHANLISYRRGRMKILDREGLEGAACECHGILLERSRHMFNGLSRPVLDGRR
jgi:CRP-like cAMP-binding protein